MQDNQNTMLKDYKVSKNDFLNMPHAQTTIVLTRKRIVINYELLKNDRNNSKSANRHNNMVLTLQL